MSAIAKLPQSTSAGPRKWSSRFWLFFIGFFLCSGLAQASVRFVPNRGQWEPNVLYRAEIPGGFFYLERNRITYHLYDVEALHDAQHDGKNVEYIKNHVVRITFPGSIGPENIVSDGQSRSYSNYFLGNDPSRWVSYVYAYNTITLKNLWKGIDMEIVADEYGVKYNFIVQPKADPDLIRLRYEGANDIALDTNTIFIHTTLGKIIEGKPYAFQKGSSSNLRSSEPAEETEVSAKYRLEGNEVSFKLGRYSRKRPLIIDPLVIFSTFSGSHADNFGFTATFNPAGQGYSGGTVFGVGFPSTTGAFQVKYAGGFSDRNTGEFGRDAGILKYSADGTQLLWATYIGGKHNEQPHSMIVNSRGDLIIMGTTLSLDFPVPATGGFDRSYNGAGDIYVLRLSEDGSQLLTTTFLGGSGRDGLNGDNLSGTPPAGPLAYNYGDMFRGEVIVDKNDNVLIASCTQSFDFPVKSAFQSIRGGGAQDACVAMFSPSLDDLIWASYFGGELQDAAYGINIDRKGNIFFCGGTQSSLPANGHVTARIGERDGYIAKLSPDGKSLTALTYVGTNRYDQAYLIQVDEVDRVYVTGQTEGNFPVSPGVYFNQGGRQFIAIYENDLKSQYKTTVFGSGRTRVDLSPSAFLVDLCGRVCVSGWGGITNSSYYNPMAGNTFGLPTTPDAFQKTTDGSDFYLIVLSREMGSLVYASYFGGNLSPEHVDGGTSRFDHTGKVYQSVCGGCHGNSDFPTTPNAWSRKNNGRNPEDALRGGCNNAFFKMDLNSSNFPPSFRDTTIEVTAGDQIDISFDIIDPDKTDSVYVQAQGNIFDPKQVAQPPAAFQADSAVGRTKAYFKWATNCSHISTDTYTVVITTRDNGCPTPKSHTGYLKIIVKQPPIPDPPGIFCLQRINDHTLDLSWGDYKTDKYLGGYKLVKRYSDGRQEEILHSITSTGDKVFRDENAAGHLTQDYCYFIYGVNICGQIGDSTRQICSIPDEDSIPSKVNVFTATVDQNKYVKVIWHKYDRDDFYYYMVYRRENKQGSRWFLYRSSRNLNDTSFVDSAVNVHTTSYCYKVIVQNQCGLQSKEGNYGCTILLTGVSIPFEHQLSWNPYIIWDGGVKKYEVIRRDPGTPDRIIKTTPDTKATDDTLNYDYGIYWYRVVAYEGPGGKGATSVSNEIELIQQPLLHVPSAFTPNDDSTNDLWNVVPVFVKDFHLKVFNRWGQAVWETSNKKELWNAIYNGNKPFNNAFIWQVDYTGWDKRKYFRHGYVTVLP